jgi:hypothetical protein
LGASGKRGHCSEAREAAASAGAESDGTGNHRPPKRAPKPAPAPRAEVAAPPASEPSSGGRNAPLFAGGVVLAALGTTGMLVGGALLAGSPLVDEWLVGDRFLLIGGITLGAGGLLVVTSIPMIVLSDDDSEPDESPPAELSVTPTGIAGRF